MRLFLCVILLCGDIANELRRFADDLEQDAERAERDVRPDSDDAA